MLPMNLNLPDTYRRTLAIYGGDAREGFTHIVRKILARLYKQTGRPVPPDIALTHYAQQLWALVKAEGQPAPLAGSDQGTELKLSDARAQELGEKFFATFRFPNLRAELEKPTRHLLGALLNPEFKTCRQSFKELDAAGQCERRDPEKSRARVSGVHCVDCPYWTALSAEKNEKLVAKDWPAERLAELTANLPVFLPEDFRALRQLMHMHVRFGAK